MRIKDAPDTKRKQDDMGPYPISTPVKCLRQLQGKMIFAFLINCRGNKGTPHHFQKVGGKQQNMTPVDCVPLGIFCNPRDSMTWHLILLPHIWHLHNINIYKHVKINHLNISLAILYM